MPRRARETWLACAMTLSQQARLQAQPLAHGVTLATFDSYEQAQQAVNRLAGEDFDVKQVSIIGTELRSIEQVTGALTVARVAMNSAFNGLMFGFMFALVLVLLGPQPQVNLAQLAVPPLVGCAIGLILGLLVYSMARRRRGYTSVQRIVPGRFAVMTSPQFAERARQIVGLKNASVVRPTGSAGEPFVSAPVGGSSAGGTTRGEDAPRYGTTPALGGRPQTPAGQPSTTEPAPQRADSDAPAP